MTTLLSLLAQTPSPGPFVPVNPPDDHAVMMGLYAAATSALILGTTILQSIWQRYEAARLAKEKKAADELLACQQKEAATLLAEQLAEKQKAVEKAALEAAATSKLNAVKLDDVLNGAGIGGTLKRLADWQISYAKENEARLGKIELSITQIHRLKLEELLKIEQLRRERDQGTRADDQRKQPEN